MCTRTSWMRLFAQARNPYSRSWLWIPGSLASLAPRNDRALVFSELPPQFGLGAMQPVALGFRQRLAGVLPMLTMIKSMPLLAKTSVAAIGSRAGIRELEPAGGVNRCDRYDGGAAPLAYGLRARERSFPGVLSSGLVHGLAARFGIGARRQVAWSQVAWPQVAVVSCRCGV
jgi:hypothetical protein